MARRSTRSQGAAGTPLVVSGRGQVTLPRDVRARLGLREGSFVLLQEEAGRLVLHPAAVAPVETYTDEQIAEWSREDRLTAREKKSLRRRWSAR